MRITRIQTNNFVLLQLQAYLLMCDDIQDQSEIRRGQPCWYLVNDRGLPAVSDSSMVEMCIYKLLKIHFKSQECYGVLQDLFLDVNMNFFHESLKGIIASATGVTYECYA